MKRTVFTLICLLATFSVGRAQNGNDMVFQPTHVIGRSFNAAGEVTKELVSDFSYLENGKLHWYDFPEYAIHAVYYYTDDYLTKENILHAGGHPVYNELNLFTYENGLIKTKSHLMDQMGNYQYWDYNYYADGRLERIDYREDNEVSRQHYHYDYEGEGKTVIETYYTDYLSQGVVVRKKTTSQYDDLYNLSSALVENYDESGNPTSATLTSYSYTEGGLLERTVTQVPDDGSWVNASTMQYVRDAEGRIVEQRNGSWNNEVGEWNYTKKIVFEFSDGGHTYTVSFYKKSGDNWVWDVFNRQTILFGDILKAQQRMLGYMVYDAMFGHGNINQLEFSMELMNQPVYLDIEDQSGLPFKLYPNPGRDNVTVKAPVENAVVRFYDMQGRLLHAQPFDFQTDIHAGSWAPGIYLWEIWDGPNRAATGKWIKE